MKIIYILSLGHSGSTLLNMILGSHSRIIGLGELINFNKNYRCICGMILKKCPFWSKIINGLNVDSIKVIRKTTDFFLKKDKYTLIKHNRMHNRLIPIDNKNELLNLNYLLYKRIFEVSSADVLVDSSKSVDRLSFIVNHYKIKPIIIHLVRDGKGVAWSYSKKYNRVLHYMRRWFIENIKFEIFMRRKKFINLFIKYEDFTANPEMSLKKILKIVDLKYEPEMLNFRSSEHHQVCGNPMRSRKNKAIKTDFSYKEMLPLKYKIIFNFLWGWLNYYYQSKKK